MARLRRSPVTDAQPFDEPKTRTTFRPPSSTRDHRGNCLALEDLDPPRARGPAWRPPDQVPEVTLGYYNKPEADAENDPRLLAGQRPDCQIHGPRAASSRIVDLNEGDINHFVWFNVIPTRSRRSTTAIPKASKAVRGGLPDQ